MARSADLRGIGPASRLPVVTPGRYRGRMTRPNMSTWIVDRIEDDLAVLEGPDATLELPASWLPAGAGEGDVLRVEVGRDGASSRVDLRLDPDARAAREAELRDLRESIPEGPAGDLSL